MIDYSDRDAFDAFSAFDDLFDDSAYEELDVVVPLLLPGLDAELDRTMSVFHLLKAYGEASTAELARVILARLREKASPVGTAMERLAYHLLLGSDPQAELLRQESFKNYAIALQAFYELTPYGRLAHFVANAAALESVPRDAARVRIVDLDVGEGIQWPPLLAALGPRRSVRITCVGAADDRTKDRLLAFANTMRLDLRIDSTATIDEIHLDSTEFLVFNCMTELPHMNKKKSNRFREFKKIAIEKIVSSGRRGVLIWGSGGANAGPFSDAHLLHSHGMFESMEAHFPGAASLSLARTAMECLFVGPACAGGGEVDDSIDVGGLEGVRVSENGLVEAEEIARRGGGGEYGVRVGEGGEVVLEWRGTPLVRVCAWR